MDRSKRNRGKAGGSLAGVVLTAAFIALITAPVLAEPITHVRTLTAVDKVSAGVCGAGAGTGTITVSGVTGTVTKAYLYWHGIDNSGTGQVYDNENVTINGNPVTGVALGDATTNCWGAGSSRAFRADVTAYVTGDGSYTIAGMSAGTGHSANGASLVVIFDDGNDANDRDLAFFEGNDSNFIQGFPGEDAGWNAVLEPINYGGGSVGAELHGSDGQNAGDGNLTFTGSSSKTFFDDRTLWDGISLPSAGTGRNGHGLWDIHMLDITDVFGAPGPYTLNMNGMTGGSDCLGLVLLVMDLEPFSAPQPEGPNFDVPPSPECGTVFAVEPGDTVAFTMQASSDEPDDVVTLTDSGAPAAASIVYDPVSQMGNPVSADFSWTTGPGDANTETTVTFTATNLEQIEVNCPVIIRVEEDLLVELASFDVTPADSQVLIEWETQLEVDNAGFYLVRKDLVTGNVARLNTGLIPGQGDIFEGAYYSYLDDTAINGVEYEYYLVDVELTGLETAHAGAVAVPNPQSTRIALVSPTYGASIQPGERPTFAWDSGGARGLRILLSADPTFGSLTATIPLKGGKARKGELTVGPKRARRLESMALSADGVLYWRIIEKTLGSAVYSSPTWRIDYATEGLQSTSEERYFTFPRERFPRLVE